MVIFVNGDVFNGDVFFKRYLWWLLSDFDGDLMMISWSCFMDMDACEDFEGSNHRGSDFYKDFSSDCVLVLSF